MSMAQEQRTRRLVEKWQNEVVDLDREIAQLEAELQEKRKKREALTNQIDAAMRSDSY